MVKGLRFIIATSVLAIDHSELKKADDEIVKVLVLC